MSYGHAGRAPDSWRYPRPDNEGLTDVADDEHMARLSEGVDAWNAWRRDERMTRPDLSHVDLSGIALGRTDSHW